MSIDSLEAENAQAHTRQKLVATIKSQKAIINQLVGVIEEANKMLLDAAATSGEADKILSASKRLVHGVAGVVKA